MLSHTLKVNLAIVFSHLLSSVGFILALFLVVHLLRAKRSPASTFAWLLAILFIPYIGVPFYLFFGGRKMKRLSKRKGMLPALTQCRNSSLQSADMDFVPDRMDLHLTGEEAFAKLVQLIESAHENIFITTFVFGNDRSGRYILDQLTQKASQGVEVRLLMDAYGSFHLRPWHLKKYKEAGGKYAFFMPVMPWPFLGRANLRNHRKMVLVDQKSAIVGGMNIADEYMGEAHDPGRWRDLSLTVEGPVVEDLYTLFLSDWHFAKKTDENEPFLFCLPNGIAKKRYEELIRLIPSGPDADGDPLYSELLSSFFAARERIWIVTPYFVPNEMLLEALCLAAGRGVDVRLVIPKKSNHGLADLVRKSYLDQISRAGVKIYRYLPGMLHAKLILVDTTAIIGSANMDLRSLFLNYELALRIHSAPVTSELTGWAEGLMSQSEVGIKRSHPVIELIEGSARLLAPLF